MERPEATLYKHFDSKEALFLEVLRTRLPPFADLLQELPSLVGTGDLRRRLERIARHALDFYTEGMPISASVLSDPELLARHRDAVHERGAGPHRPLEAIADHLRAEQQTGHLDAAVSAAAMLLGACYQRAFLATFAGTATDDEDADRFAHDVVDTLMAGLRVE